MEYVDVAIAICTLLGMSVVQIFVSCSWLYWMIFLWYCLVRPGKFRDGSLPPVCRGSIRTNSFTHSLFNQSVHLFIITLYVLRRIHLLIHYSIHSFSLICITPNSLTHSLFNSFIHSPFLITYNKTHFLSQGQFCTERHLVFPLSITTVLSFP